MVPRRAYWRKFAVREGKSTESKMYGSLGQSLRLLFPLDHPKAAVVKDRDHDVELQPHARLQLLDGPRHVRTYLNRTVLQHLSKG